MRVGVHHRAFWDWSGAGKGGDQGGADKGSDGAAESGGDSSRGKFGGSSESSGLFTAFMTHPRHAVGVGPCMLQHGCV